MNIEMSFISESTDNYIRHRKMDGMEPVMNRLNVEETNYQLKPQRNQANARERDRTHRSYIKNKLEIPSVNSAFTTLRTLIPTEPKDRKLSKIETLRLACSYITHLGTQLLSGPVEQPCVSSSFIVDADGANRPQLCTFCLQMHKKYKKENDINIKPQYTEEFDNYTLYYQTTSSPNNLRRMEYHED